MANIDVEATRKALKILSIKSVQRQESSRLLDLPRELRDLIYWYALVEPSKWNKRHAVGCTYLDLYGAGERPPYRISQGDNDPLWAGPGGDIESVRARACHHLCVKRKALALLRVNQQVREEAEPQFWHNNVFCFDSAENFVTIFQDLPKYVLWKIRKLSLKITAYKRVFQFRFPLPKVYPHSEAVAKRLDSMKNLADLELSPEFVDVLWYKRLCWPKLKFLRCVVMDTISYVSDGVRFSVEAGLTASLKVANHPRKSFGPHQTYCFFCWDLLAKMHDTGRVLDEAVTANRRPWQEVIRRRLECLSLTQAVRVPPSLQLTLLGGARRNVRIWGLPLPANVRAKQRRQIERAKELASSPARSAPAPVMLIDDEEGEIPIPFGRGARHWRCHKERQIQSHESRVQQRKKKAQVEAEREATRQKKAHKNSVKARGKAESEAQAERRAARKRSGR